MARTSIMWFRRDLRVRDLPALVEAARADRLVPLFVFDERLLTTGRFPSGVRTDFMLGCLRVLDRSLRERGSGLVVRHGRPEDVLPELAREVGADEVRWTADVSPWSRERDARVTMALEAVDVAAHAMPGACVVDDPAAIRTKQGKPYTVFTPFSRTWREAERRTEHRAPKELPALPAKLHRGTLPSLEELGLRSDVAGPFEPGEDAARTRLDAFVRHGLDNYADRRDAPKGGSSQLSAYLRWGCISPLSLDQRVASSGARGAEDYRTEIAWRDFYSAVLIHFPEVTRQEFVERYRGLEWTDASTGVGAEHLEAWKRGLTGYPLVDAGMRQLAREGWMHNRVRMVVGSFITKDLHLDWREGEAWFMERLIDGDMAANNGGWQWISSVGTDPAPYFQRLFNPITQQEKFDADGEYVRRYVPELADVPAKKLSKPWTMSDEEQEASGCRIGRDYPGPIVDHAEERKLTVERYRAVAESS